MSSPYDESLSDSGSPLQQVVLGIDSVRSALSESQHARQPPPESFNSGRKRKRSAATYPRKRALLACEKCRARKIKCNNARPSCRSCTVSQSRCVYDDPDDLSTYDPASIQILSRLDQVLLRLDQLPAVLVQDQIRLRSASLDATSHPLRPQETPSMTDGTLHQVDPGYDRLQIPLSRTKPDTILQWPVFENLYPANYITDASLVAEMNDDGFSLDDDGFQDKPRALRAGLGLVNQDAILYLVRRFLSLVHVKNPILEPDTLSSFAHAVAEDGPQWDAPSCIVLLACALGSIAKPFIPTHDVEARSSTSLQADREGLQKGEIYFDLARKRLGSLDKGVMAAQSHFLAGVYLMYRLRPLSAWMEFHSATRAYYVYLQYRARLSPRPVDDGMAEQRRRIEQRLYWSCYKSECELRGEMDVPNSLLADHHFPDLYPSPPDISSLTTAGQNFTSPSTVTTAPQDPGNESVDLCPLYEQSWFYYLTEISIRRISNRVLHLLYQNDASSWVDSKVPSLVKTVIEFEQQLEDWYVGLPPPIQFQEDTSSSHELPALVHGRFLELKSWIYRPLLYYAIHSPREAHNRHMALPYVDKLLTNCVRILRLDLSKHRHHGTWFATRSHLTAALLIMGAVRCGTIALPTDWPAAVHTGLAKLQYWADEAPGVISTIRVIEDFLARSMEKAEGTDILYAS
ncbi:hypothetical protein F1880_004758 [Penicillium rolfsii]|nr:hypothetical protein F1880_004758 [Penicillium rolfsii]